MRIVTHPKKPFIPKRPPNQNPAPFIQLTPIKQEAQTSDGPR